MQLVFRTLEDQRKAAEPFIAGLCWALVPLVAVAAYASGEDWVTTLVAGSSMALGGSLALRIWRGTHVGRALSGVVLMGLVSLLVSHGGTWQIDMHMAYFASLAVLMVYADWTVILAAAATVAVHHLTLSYLLPAAVFPDSASLTRVILHAVILIIEAATLGWVCANLTSIFAVSQHLLATAQQAVQNAQELNLVADEARHAQSLSESKQRTTEHLAISRERDLVVHSIGEAIGKLSEKALTYRLTQDVPEAYASLKDNFNIAISHLEDSLTQVRLSAHEVLSGAHEISRASDDLSRQTETQAANLAETAAALNDITDAVQRTASGAKNAHEIVQVARTDAEHSDRIVQSAITAMDKIKDSAQKIGTIIGVIDEIAFQTNLLALNAGVEAARAGEAGRGFAVVAQEVRSLAQRSADAAKEIKTLISNSNAQVLDGVSLVSETGQALSRILDQVAAINDVVTGIHHDASQQAAGLSQVNTAITEMDRVTQRNAAMAEQATAASQTLTAESTKLDDLISAFQLGETATSGLRRQADLMRGKGKKVA